MWMKVESIAIYTGEMPDQQRGKKVFGFVAGKKFQMTNIVAGYVEGSVRLQKEKHSLCG
ncbi:MAG: hypothetical protein LBF42_01635 [Puniceicoccales bacterium]|jgi:hypothetical protein|nr:hypothetical protein [Puniceicoccales bacterium]